jgi:hypothetical protein
MNDFLTNLAKQVLDCFNTCTDREITEIENPKTHFEAHLVDQSFLFPLLRFVRRVL